MRARLSYAWYRLRASLWFVPSLMLAAAVVLSFTTIWLDVRISIRALTDPGGEFFIGPGGSRELLSTIAASMISVASLVFSITLVVLQLASSQLGPRLISRFMQDKVNQIVLGTFIATFLYALLVLRSVSENGGEVFVPHISIVVAIILAIASLAWLVFFIHHVAESIQADTVIAEIGEGIRRSVGKMFPAVELEPAQIAQGALPPLDRVTQPPAEIRAQDSGYIQAVDVPALLACAARNGLVLELPHRPGHFVVAGTVAACVWPRAALTDEVTTTVLKAVIIGYRRTPTQDIEFAISELVQIALRALSPSINDPITAMTCVDRLSAALAEIMQRPPPPSLIPDEAGEIRLMVHPTTFEGAIDAAFNDIRQCSEGQVRVLIRLLEALTTLAGFISLEEHRRPIEKHAEMVAELCRNSIPAESDRADAERRLARLRETLGDR